MRSVDRLYDDSGDRRVVVSVFVSDEPGPPPSVVSSFFLTTGGGANIIFSDPTNQVLVMDLMRISYFYGYNYVLIACRVASAEFSSVRDFCLVQQY